MFRAWGSPARLFAVAGCTSDPQGTAPTESSPLIVGLDADPALLPDVDRVAPRVTDDAGEELFADAVPGPPRHPLPRLMRTGTSVGM